MLLFRWLCRQCVKKLEKDDTQIEVNENEERDEKVYAKEKNEKNEMKLKKNEIEMKKMIEELKIYQEKITKMKNEETETIILNS